VQKGKLGTEAQRRVIFVWEGAVATLPDYPVVVSIERFKRRLRRWDQALGYWEINRWALNLMWSLLARTDFRIDLAVTTRQPEFAQAVARKCEAENWPVRYVFAEEAPKLGRLLVSMPDVERVYYGLEEQRWAFGPHGYFISPDAPLTVS
jgi:hypothetical protein